MVDTNYMQMIAGVICRRGSDPLKPGYQRGFRCKCGEELQVSPDGVRQIRAGAEPLCTRCGLEKAESDSNALTFENPGVRHDPQRQQMPADTVEALRYVLKHRTPK